MSVRLSYRTVRRYPSATQASANHNCPATILTARQAHSLVSHPSQSLTTCRYKEAEPVARFSVIRNVFFVYPSRSTPRSPLPQSSHSHPYIQAIMTEHYDVVVIGGGFAGCFHLYTLRKLGFKVHLFDAAPDFGGIWRLNCVSSLSSIAISRFLTS